jgi:hypothetical protein
MRALVCALGLVEFALAGAVAFALADDVVILDNGAWRVRVSPATLSAEGTRSDGRRIVFSRAAAGAGPIAELRSSASEASWKLPQRKLAITASLRAEGFRMAFRATEAGAISWPVLGDEPGLEAVVLPRGEGLYLPLREPRWRAFLTEQSPFDTMESLSMPLWGLRYSNLTVAYIAENPFDNDLGWNLQGTELQARLTHRFQANRPGREHSVLVRVGGTSPVEAAFLFRDWFARRYAVTTYQDKIRALPESERLLGAAHIYLWANSLLAPEDVRDWPGLARALGKDPRALTLL